jgi:hypothetical protein
VYIAIDTYDDDDKVAEHGRVYPVAGEGYGSRPGSGGWVLNWPLHDWLTKHGIEYQLHWARPQWKIQILNADEVVDDVMFFLLKWGI